MLHLKGNKGNKGNPFYCLSAIFILFTLITPFTVCQANLFNSIYTGVSIGESLTTVQIKSATIANATLPGLAAVTASNAQIHYLKDDTWMLAAFAGYGFSFNPFYLGGEIYFKLSNPKKTIYNALALTSTTGPVTSALAESTSVKTKKLELAFDLRPGVLLTTSNLLYGRVGVSRNTISLNSALSAALFDAATFGALARQGIDVSTTQNVLGLRLGVGMEQFILRCLALRLDYIFTKYKRISLAPARTAVLSTAPLTLGTFLDARKIRVYNHSFMIGMSYYW